ncbi:hypothetical protein PV779_57655 [Streptomyces sp. ID01-9D]|nr:hypothetical protein [Streptomyces sp. ID01-9D]
MPPSTAAPRNCCTGPPALRSWRAAAPATAAATVRNPAAVWAARSRATSRRPYQKPGLPSAGRTGAGGRRAASPRRAGEPGGGAPVGAVGGSGSNSPPSREGLACCPAPFPAFFFVHFLDPPNPPLALFHASGSKKKKQK